jgi:hypothetical protein
MKNDLQNEIKLLKEKVALLEKCVKLNDELEQFRKLAQPMKEYIPYPVYPQYPVYPRPYWHDWIVWTDDTTRGTTTADPFPTTTTYLNKDAQVTWTS